MKKEHKHHTHSHHEKKETEQDLTQQVKQEADEASQKSNETRQEAKNSEQENAQSQADGAEVKSEPTAEEQVESLTEEVNSLKDKLLRQIAEFDNYKKQKDREISNIRKFASEDLIVDMLPILDDVERVLQNADKFLEQTPDAKAYIDGVKLIQQNLMKLLENKGVKRLESLGQTFDVNLHEALSQMEREGAEPEQIIEEYVPGYTMNERVIRHAKVVVAK